MEGKALKPQQIEAFVKPGNCKQIDAKKFAAQIGSIVPENEHGSGKRAWIRKASMKKERHIRFYFDAPLLVFF